MSGSPRNFSSIRVRTFIASTLRVRVATNFGRLAISGDSLGFGDVQVSLALNPYVVIYCCLMESLSMYERVIANLLANREVWREIAQQTQVPYSTLRKIASRYTKNPGVDKIEKLHSYFQTQST